MTPPQIILLHLDKQEPNKWSSPHCCSVGQNVKSLEHHIIRFHVYKMPSALNAVYLYLPAGFGGRLPDCVLSGDCAHTSQNDAGRRGLFECKPEDMLGDWEPNSWCRWCADKNLHTHAFPLTQTCNSEQTACLLQIIQFPTFTIHN